MRRKLITATTAGVLTLGGLAVAVPALADSDGATRSPVERITEALSGLVEDGSLTQEQADEVASALSDADLGGHGPWGGGGGPWGGAGLETAASTLGLTEDELRTALEADGTTLADVAEQQGVAVDTLVDALVTAVRERAAQAVEDGDLTQEEADERLADVEERVTERVTSDDWGAGRGPRGPGGWGGQADD